MAIDGRSTDSSSDSNGGYSGLSEQYASRDRADKWAIEYAREEARSVFWDAHDETEYGCPDCDDPEPVTETTIEIHHIDGNPFNNALENLIGLCHEHHKLQHRRQITAERLRDMRSEMDLISNSS